jgi:hypothetical protein
MHIIKTVYVTALTTALASFQSCSPTPVASRAAPASSSLKNNGYIEVVDKWRRQLGLSTLAQDTLLEANAFKTCSAGKGEMIHQLNPGSLAQVLAPGKIHEDFESIFVGGWLCETPNRAGMAGICANVPQDWEHLGTAHADILTSTGYSKIGCASAGGVVGCDLA